MPFKDTLYSQSHLATEGGILLYNLTFLFMTMNEKMSFICHMAIDIQIYISLFIQINIYSKRLHFWHTLATTYKLLSSFLLDYGTSCTKYVACLKDRVENDKTFF